MRKYAVIFFMVLAGASFAQPPRIDSMFVDEMKSELHIYGSFGSAQGKAWVDSVEMAVKSWTDSLIFISIPDTGRGSAGPVLVIVNGIESKKTMITSWSGSWNFMHYWPASLPQDYGYSLNFVIRMDLHSILRNSNNILINFIPQKSTNVYGYADEGFHDPCGIGYYQTGSNVFVQDTAINYIRGFHCFVEYDGLQKIFSLNVTSIKGILGTMDSCGSMGPTQVKYEYHVPDISFDVYLDSIFKIIQSDEIANNFGRGFFDEYKIIGTGPNFPPPQKAFALQAKPNLISPTSGTIFSYKNNITLTWDSLSVMSNYHVQVSLDSTFKSAEVDTIVSLLGFQPLALTGLTKHFWRVAGINSEGESRWSDVWNFWTGKTAGVKEVNIGPTLSAFPNPFSKELTISYSLPESEDVRIILYDLAGRVMREKAITASSGENTSQWDISGLPSGSYVLGLVTSKEERTEIVNIIH